MEHWKPDFETAVPLESGEEKKVLGEELRKTAENSTQGTLNRREALSTLGHVSAGLAIGSVAKKITGSEEAISSSQNDNVFVKPKTVTAAAPKASPEQLVPGEYAMGSLAGEKVGKSFSLYFGLQEGDTIPPVLKIDFLRVLDTAYDRKKTLLEEKYNTDSSEAEELQAHYQGELKKRETQRERYSIQDLKKIGAEQVQLVDASIEWDKFQKIPQYKNFTHDEVKLLRYLTRAMDGEILLAYSLTELMPSAEDFTKNIRVYEFLALHQPFILLAWPSLGDSKKSAGPYQFTDGAVGISSTGDKNGALIINQLLPPSERIPNELENLLSFPVQMRAAQLFVINNFAQLLFRIRKNESKKKDRLLQLIQFIRSGGKEQTLALVASANNNPNDAITAFVDWLDSGRQGEIKDFVKKTETYITKSQGNYRALKSYQ
jgi:hypothetical protein